MEDIRNMKRVCLSIRTFDRDDADWYIMNTEDSIKEIAEVLGCTSGALHGYYHKAFPEQFRKERKIACYSRSKMGDKNPMKGVRGKLHPCFKGDCSDCKGYVLVLKPEWFTGRPNSKHIFKHHYEYCKAHNLTEIPQGCAIHHKDKNPLNNVPDNLELLTNSDHTKLHAKERAKC